MLHTGVQAILAVVAAAYVFTFIARCVLLALAVNDRLLLPLARNEVFQQMVKTQLRPASKKTTVAEVLSIVDFLTAWPVLRSWRQPLRERSTDLQFGARATLNPLDVRASVLRLGIAGAVVAARQTGLTYALPLAGLEILVVIGVAARATSYLLRGGVAVRLRRSRFAPYRTFLVLAAIDTTALILMIAALYHVTGDAPINFTALQITVAELFAFKHWDALIRLPQPELVVPALGLLTYSTFAKGFLRRADFRRRDDDVRALTSMALVSGDYVAARKWLTHDKQQDLSSLMVRSVLEFCDGNVADAFEFARRRQRAEGKDDDIDTLTVGLLPSAGSASPPATRWLTFLRIARDSGASDTALALSVQSLGVYRLLSPDEIIEKVAPIFPQERYPLVKAAILCGIGRTTAALELLGHMTPEAGIDEVTCSCWILIYGHDDENWEAKHLARVAERARPDAAGLGSPAHQRLALLTLLDAWQAAESHSLKEALWAIAKRLERDGEIDKILAAGEHLREAEATLSERETFARIAAVRRSRRPSFGRRTR